MDRLTKPTHFLPVKTTYKVTPLARLFIIEVVRFNGVPTYIVSNRDLKFTSRFWKALHHEMGTKLNLNTFIHPQPNGHVERTNYTIKDTLWPCILESVGSWNYHLPLI